MSRPNVLILMGDQHNAKCLGAYGHQMLQTPNLDRLAAAGVRFDSAFVQCPICSPSRMCYLTSQYAHNHGYFGLRGPTPHRLPSMFSFFRANGYYTGAIGKVHLPEGWIEPHADFFCESLLGRENTPNESYQEFLERHGVKEGEDEVTRNRLAVGHFLESVDGRPDFLPKELSREGFALEQARQFLKDKPEDKPFLLWFTLSKPHPDYKPAQEYWDLYPENPEMPVNADDNPSEKLLPFRRTWNQDHENPPADLEPADYHSLRNRKLRGYFGNITHLDWAVGEIMTTIEERGLGDNTIIIYCTDHGDFACEHGLLEKAPVINTDAVCRIPFIWSWPGHLPQNESRHQLVQAIDLLPTLANLAGLPAMSMWDGKDVTEVLNSSTANVHEAVFSENPFCKSIVTDQWRMVSIPEGIFPGDSIMGELYNRLDDPWERKNLYHDAKCQSTVSTLRKSLLDWLITSNRPVSALPVPPHPSFETSGADFINNNASFPEDGKTSPEQIFKTMRKGIDKYL